MNYKALMTALTDLGFNCQRAVTDRCPTEHSLHKRVTVRTARGEAIYAPNINVAPENAKDEELPNYTLFFEVYFYRGHSGTISSASRKTIKIQDEGWVEAIKAWLPGAVELAKVKDAEEAQYQAKATANYNSQAEMVDTVKAAFYGEKSHHPDIGSVQALSDSEKAVGIVVSLRVYGTPAEVVEKLRVVLAHTKKD